MIVGPLPFTKFLFAWVPALAVAAAVPAPRLGDLFIVDFGGVPIPVVTCSLGALGIAMSRPFARNSERNLGWPLYILVTLIMLIVAELWIIESRPDWLFAFVVAIGLGFSGFSLLELCGEQVKDFIRAAFSKAAETIGTKDP